MSNLAKQIREALSMFARNGTEPALIGGLAVVAHQVVHATKDVDFLVAAEASDKIHSALLDLGYQCLYRSQDAANYAWRRRSGFALRASPPCSPPIGTSIGARPAYAGRSLAAVIARGLERHQPRQKPDQFPGRAFCWHSDNRRLLPVHFLCGGKSVQLPCATSAAMPMLSPSVGCG